MKNVVWTYIAFEEALVWFNELANLPSGDAWCDYIFNFKINYLKILEFNNSKNQDPQPPNSQRFVDNGTMCYASGITVQQQ